MKTLVSIFRRACTSGGWASAASAGAMAAAGVRDCQSTLAPINAVSHWIWADPALRKDRPSLRYTATGYAIHHLASIFWAHLFEGLSEVTGRPRSNKELLVDAATVAAVAAVVDLRCTPERLTPGFERRLQPVPLTAVYVAFGLGLAWHALRREPDDRR